LGERLARLARETGAEVHATNSGWVDSGVNFGSRYVVPVRRPAIAVAWDAPVSSVSAGAARFVLEQQYGYPVTPVRTAALNSAELDRFHVLIFPEGGDYAQALGDSGIQRLKQWVQSGGTVVSLGSAVGFLSNPKLALLDVSQENALRDDEKRPGSERSAGSEASAGTPPGTPATGGTGAQPAATPASAGGTGRPRAAGTSIASQTDFEKAIRAATELPDSASGAIVRARIRPDFWLTAGLRESVHIIISGRSIYTPIKTDKGVNAVYFEEAEKLVAGGHLWSENRKQMAFKPLVLAANSGRGVVVGFTADPNFRGMQDGMNLLFLNAVFRGAARAGRGSEYGER
jgi:hypothetical protein